MPLNQRNSRVCHRTLFAGILEKVTILKRGDDQREGTVTAYKVFQCRKSLITKTKEPIAGDMLADHRLIWHIPRVELDRVGINYLNPADRIVDGLGRIWQPESTTTITIKLFETHIDVHCLRVV